MPLVTQSAGQVRPHADYKETPSDAFLRNDGLGVFAVASGEQGSQAGAAAAQVAVEALREEVDKLGVVLDAVAKKESTWQVLKQELHGAFERASRRVKMATAMQISEGEAKAAVTMALVRDGFAAVVHAGNTRAYLVHKKRVVRLSRANQDEIADTNPGVARTAAALPALRMGKPQALGQTEAIELDGVSFQAGAGDALLLVSPGVTDKVRGDELKALVRGSKDADTAVSDILALAAERTVGMDLTCVAIRILDEAALAAAPPAEDPWGEPDPALDETLQSSPARLPGKATAEALALERPEGGDWSKLAPAPHEAPQGAADLLAGLSAEQNKALMAHGRPTSIRAGEVIYCEGEPGDCIYVLRKGAVELIRKGDVFTRVEAPEVVGARAILGDPHDSTARASAAAHAIAVDTTAVLDACEKEPALAARLYRNLARLLADELDRRG